MDSSSKLDALAMEANLAAEVVAALKSRGYDTPASLWYSVKNPDDQENMIWELLVGVENLAENLDARNWSSSPDAGRLRRFIAGCGQVINRESAPEAGGTIVPSIGASLEPSFRRLDRDAIRAQRDTFLASYPGELLNGDNTPGVTFRSKVFNMLKSDQELVYLPPRKCTSQNQEEKARESRSRASDPLSMLARAWNEEDPESPENEQVSGLFGLNQWLELRRNCFVLTGHCHLASWKRLDAKLMEAYCRKVPESSGLRRPNFEEFLDADKTLFLRVFELVNEKGWSLDEALHEFSTSRPDIDNLLQARLKPTPQQFPHAPGAKGVRKTIGKGQYEGYEHLDHGKKGKAKGKGKKGKKDGKVKGKGGKQQKALGDLAQGGDQLAREDAQGNGICTRFNLGNCTRADTCKFKHVCAKWVNGAACGKAHPATKCTRS